MSTSSLASSDSHCSLVTSSPLQQVVTSHEDMRGQVSGHLVGGGLATSDHTELPSSADTEMVGFLDTGVYS